MKVDIYMRLFVGDYLKDTMHLSTLQHGAYMLLIMHYYTNGEPLPDDNEYLAAVARLSLGDWSKHRNTIAKFFVIGSGKWTHKRVESELKAAREKRESYSLRGKLGNSKRWTNRPAIAQPSPSDTPSNRSGSCETVAVSLQSSLDERESDNAASFPEIPPMTRKAFDTLAEMRGVSKECAEWFWNTYDARNWTDSAGQPVAKVEPLLLNTWKNWQTHAARQQSSKRGNDRSKGTLNEGTASDYAQV